jgi:hypothetical protein
MGGRFEGALKASLILTRNHFSTQALAQRNQILALRGREKWSEFSSECLSCGWSAMSEEGEEGYLYLTLKTSRYCAESRFLGTSDMGSELPRGPAETQQRRHIGSSDPGSVLSSPWPKLASGAISVLPTRRRYYRQWLRVREKVSKHVRVNSKLFSLTWVIS